MAKLMFAVVAERVVVDRFTNHLFIHSVAEELSVPEPPAALLERARKAKKPPAARGRFHLLLHWRRTEPKHPERTYTGRVELVGPNGKVLATTLQEFSLREHVYVRNVITYEALPIVGEGTYTARVAVKGTGRWQRAGETSFQLKYQRSIPPSARVRLQ